MKRFYDSELETFRVHLIKMGEISIKQVQDAITSLDESDAELAKRVIAGDDEVDDLEVEMDEEAICYMNMRSPIASDLRLLIVGMKASHDLERVADEAVGIAKRVKRLAKEIPLKPYIDIPRMASIALEMLRDALDCFLDGDAEKAATVISRDKEVDAINKQLYRELTGHMVEDQETISRGIELMFISRSIERIADHATNIAEEMIYLVKGKNVRGGRTIQILSRSLDQRVPRRS